MAQISSPTSDLSKFEGLAFEDAIDLLKAYMFQRHRAKFLRDGVRLYFNKEAHLVFLADDKLRLGVLSHGELREWVSCRVCGVEGFGDEGEIREELCENCTQRAA